MDLCFIREVGQADPFVESIEQHLECFFSGSASWYTEGKQDNQLEVVIAEVSGIGSWEKEEELALYLENNAQPQFLAWLQGYRIQLDIKDEHEGCSHCGKNESRVEV